MIYLARLFVSSVTLVFSLIMHLHENETTSVTLMENTRVHVAELNTHTDIRYTNIHVYKRILTIYI